MKIAAGLLIYRRIYNNVEVLIGHPGGPFYSKKNAGVWTIPKGETEPDEELLTAAAREFKEELGFDPPHADTMIELTPVKQPGKINHIWAFEGDPDLIAFNPGTFEIDWPPRSGKKQLIPEVDRIEWLSLAKAKQMLWPVQGAFIDELADKLGVAIQEEAETPTPKPDQTSLF